MLPESNLDAAWAIASKRVKPGKENRAAFLGALIIARNPRFEPHHAGVIVEALQALARRIKRLCEDDCNIGLDESGEKRLAALCDEFGALATACGFNAKSGGDPRGPCAYLIDPGNERAGDGWGGGWAVFT